MTLFQAAQSSENQPFNDSSAKMILCSPRSGGVAVLMLLLIHGRQNEQSCALERAKNDAAECAG